MGIRASYVILSNGKPSCYYSHWGGGTILHDFFFGPEEAIGFIESAKPAESLLDEVWCEGAVCMDMDANELFVFEKESESVIRQLWFELMHIVWKGWKITPCAEGILDVASRIGADAESLVYDPEPDPSSSPSHLEQIRWQTGVGAEKKEKGHRKPWKDSALAMNSTIRRAIRDGKSAGPWLTIATISDGNALRDYVVSGHAVPEVVAAGPQLLEWFSAAEPGLVPSLEEMKGPKFFGGCVYARADEKRLYVGSGRDPYAWASPDELIAMLAKEVTGSGAVNPSTILRQMTSSLAREGVEQVKVNPDFFASGEFQVEASESSRIFEEASKIWLSRRR